MTTTANLTTANDLAKLAGVYSPDSPTSPGAVWLLRIASSVTEYLANDDGDDEDVVHNVAEGAEESYTYPRWQIFTDLGLWNEDVTSISGPISDLTDAAGTALYLAAERLVRALIAEDAR